MSSKTTETSLSLASWDLSPVDAPEVLCSVGFQFFNELVGNYVLQSDPSVSSNHIL